MKVALLLLVLVERNQSYITYCDGQMDLLIWQIPEICQNIGVKASYTKTITFPGTFANVPQFIMFVEGYDIKYTANEFTIKLSSIDQTMCTITINCLNTNPMGAYFFKWIAVDDNRITVLNKTANVTNQVSQTFSFDHNNKYATEGFVSFISFGQTHAFDFCFNVTSITSDKVFVQFTKSTTNMLSMGFQVVIGTKDAFTTTPIMNITNLLNLQFQGKIVDVQTDKILYIAKAGFQWTNTGNNVRLSCQYTTTDTTINYKFTQWGGSSLNRLSYQEVWMNKKNYRVLYPYLCSKMRIAKKIYNNHCQIKLYVEQLSKYFYSGDSQTLTQDPGATNLNLIVSIQCPYGFKIVGQVLKCINCIKQSYDLSTDCYSGMNFVEYRINLFQKDYVYQQVSIAVTESGVTINQLVVGPYSTILSLQIENE